MRCIIAIMAILLIDTPSWGAIGDTYFCEKFSGHQINKDGVKHEDVDLSFMFIWKPKTVHFTYTDGYELEIEIHKQNDDGFVLFETPYDDDQISELESETDRYDENTNIYSYVSIGEEFILNYLFNCTQFRKNS